MEVSGFNEKLACRRSERILLINKLLIQLIAHQLTRQDAQLRDLLQRARREADYLQGGSDWRGQVLEIRGQVEEVVIGYV